MKIFNIEDGQNKVYVQFNDVMMLMQLDCIIPKEVFVKHFLHPFIVVDENRFEFSEFTEPSTIEFFQQCDWIPDFKHYAKMSEEEFWAEGHAIQEKMNSIADQWNSMSVPEREANDDLHVEYERLEFKMRSIAEILWTKQGHKVMPFPIVPDSDGFIVNNDDCEYIARQGLNPLQVLVYRKDGKDLDRKTDIIPQGLIQSSESILISENLDNNQFFGSFERSRELSEDSKYLVTSFIIIPEKVEDRELTTEKTSTSGNKTNDKPMSLSKRIKNWINRKFK